VPEGMPAALRQHCTPSTVFPAAAWAGFTHAGR
jgi:hypothetical protein